MEVRMYVSPGSACSQSLRNDIGRESGSGGVVALLRGGGGENLWYGVYGVDGEGGGVDVN